MKTRIKYEDVDFYQDNKKKVTVAVIDGCSLDAYMDYLAEVKAPIQDESSLTYDDFMTIPEQLMMPSTIRSKSTCSNSDNWDPEIGKRQAFFKLCRTYNKMKNRAFKRMIKYTENQNELFRKMLDKGNNRVSHYDNLVRHLKEN